eukprot:TRINITY_DN18516_c0_g1_i10.p1 TRINITY_DN18516_c0_g1~~TRINITY_DN18516_c0_g1_i10.p1  ORF type:complete len:139 (-),score=13.42 TRINITY_DN18516_c0_g1_i10:296-712(-)
MKTCTSLKQTCGEQWPDCGCEGLKVQRAHQPTSQCQGTKKNNKMKNSAHQIKLIDNTYSPADAREVLCSLLNDKITFLNVQIHSIHERFGKNAMHLKKRITELQNEKTELLHLIKEWQDGDTELEIQSVINIKAKQLA